MRNVYVDADSQEKFNMLVQEIQSILNNQKYKFG